ncbi:hypothetical protein EDB85DRAFT_1860999, partial [Lactarius pseudohatsudake]
DFEYAADKEPLQQFDVVVGREVGEYAVQVSRPNAMRLGAYVPKTRMSAKFSNVSSVTLFLPAFQGADTTRIYYVGFLGQWSGEPVIAVHESQANIADHEKI